MVVQLVVQLVVRKTIETHPKTAKKALFWHENSVNNGYKIGYVLSVGYAEKPVNVAI